LYTEEITKIFHKLTVDGFQWLVNQFSTKVSLSSSENSPDNLDVDDVMYNITEESIVYTDMEEEEEDDDNDFYIIEEEIEEGYDGEDIETAIEEPQSHLRGKQEAKLLDSTAMMHDIQLVEKISSTQTRAECYKFCETIVDNSLKSLCIKGCNEIPY